ncbi:hypothetical protein C4D60_Mb05t00090 [Musa balbisiana]|uniref:Uncharacterized protein n=1 Tax=Musa balbisiana TaxID=52838 RepID=A0A4S8JSM0_MUSBA|nr:hypothetical protein C4D60_Mb05t00090 [Musa balbisiana]
MSSCVFPTNIIARYPVGPRCVTPRRAASRDPTRNRIIDKVLLDCRQVWCSASSEQGKMTKKKKKKKKKLRGRRKWMATNRRRRCCLQHWDPEHQRQAVALLLLAAGGVVDV